MQQEAIKFILFETQLIVQTCSYTFSSENDHFECICIMFNEVRYFFFQLYWEMLTCITVYV